MEFFFLFFSENEKFHGKLRRLFNGKTQRREAYSPFSRLPSFPTIPTEIQCDPGKLVAWKSKMSDSGRVSRQTEAVPAVAPNSTLYNRVLAALVNVPLDRYIHRYRQTDTDNVPVIVA